MIYTNEYLVDLYLGFSIHLYESIFFVWGAQLNESIVKKQRTTNNLPPQPKRSTITHQLPQCI
jgi:hypothetical protein